MNTLESIFAAILGNAALLAVLGWIGKEVFEKILERNTKIFEADLQAKADLTIEHIKNDLQMRSLEHQVRFTGLHERRGEVIAELNTHIVCALWAAESFLTPFEFSGEPDKKVKHQEAIQKLVDLFQYFDKNRIYLPRKLGEAVDKLVEDVRSHVIKVGTYLAFDDTTMTLQTWQERTNVWMEGWSAIKNQVPLVRAELETEFRILLGDIE